jgi:hypothetical protein
MVLKVTRQIKKLISNDCWTNNNNNKTARLKRTLCAIVCSDINLIQDVEMATIIIMSMLI